MLIPQIFFFFICRFEFRYFIKGYIGMYLAALREQYLVLRHKNCHISGTTGNLFKILDALRKENRKKIENRLILEIMLKIPGTKIYRPNI